MEALRLEAEARVRTLCERLVPDQREVLLLRLLAGFTVDEVARTLDKTPGAVKAEPSSRETDPPPATILAAAVARKPIVLGLSAHRSGA